MTKIGVCLTEAKYLKAVIDDLVAVGGEERRGPYSIEAKWDNVKRKAAQLVSHLQEAQ